MTGEIAGQPPTTVLVVCTANVCRSPLAQQTMRSALSGSGWLSNIDVVSAGANAEEHSAMCDVSAGLLTDESGRAFAGAHRSRALTRQMIAAAGIVLTAEKDHRSAIARLAPGSQAKTFTLKEAVILSRAAEQRIENGSAVRPKDLPELAHLLHSMRGTTPMSPPQTTRSLFGRRRTEPEDPLTIVDGHGRPIKEHEAATVETRTTAMNLSAALTALV